MNSSEPLPNKKTYQSPALIRYGSLTEMTAGQHVRGSKKDSSPVGSKTG